MSSNDWNYGPDHRKHGLEEELEEKLSRLVEGAIDAVDFEGLSEKIKSTIEENRQKIYEQRVQTPPAYEQRRQTPVMKPREILPVYRELPGKYSGPVSIAVGITGLAVAGVSLLSAGIGSLLGSTAISTVGMIVSGICTAGFGAVFGKGIALQKKVKRYLRYQNLWKGQTHITIEDLQRKTGISEKQITKDLQTIVEQNLLPVAHLDEKETCIILDEEVYQQYKDAEEGRRQREAEEARKRKEEAELQAASEDVKLQRLIVKEEESFLKELRIRKNGISSLLMREKVSTLENTISRMYQYVKNNPQQYSQIGRMRDYYIPTMMKLLGTYTQIENQPIQKDNILKTKKEIEDSMDMMNQAMEVMFDDLFMDVAMDTSADISVLETMLSRDGWSKDPVLKPDENAPGPLVF